MKIELRFFATLKDYENSDQTYTTDKNQLCIADILEDFKINPEEVKIIFINGLHSKLDSPVHNGDRVGIFPPVGGG